MYDTPDLAKAWYAYSENFTILAVVLKIKVIYLFIIINTFMMLMDVDA